MHEQKQMDEFPVGLSGLTVLNRDEAEGVEDFHNISLTHPESVPFIEFIPATPKLLPSFLWIAGVIMLLAVLGINGVALPKFIRVPAFVDQTHPTTELNGYTPSLDTQDIH